MGRNLWGAVTIKDVVHIAKFVSKLMQFYVRDTMQVNRSGKNGDSKKRP